MAKRDEELLATKMNKLFADYFGDEVATYTKTLWGEKKERAIKELSDFLEWYRENKNIDGNQRS